MCASSLYGNNKKLKCFKRDQVVELFHSESPLQCPQINILSSAEGSHVASTDRIGRLEEELGHKMSPPVFCLHNKNTMKK